MRSDMKGRSEMVAVEGATMVGEGPTMCVMTKKGRGDATLCHE